MSRNTGEEARLGEVRRRQAAKAPPLVEVIRGTLVRSLLTCGKAGCRCRRSVRNRHGPYWYVAVSAAHVARARRGIAAYQRLWGTLCRVSEINLALLRLKKQGE